MAYEKTTWKNRLVEKPRTFRQQQNADGTVTLVPEEGQVYEVGTPVNAANLQKIEDAVAAQEQTLTQHKDEFIVYKQEIGVPALKKSSIALTGVVNFDTLASNTEYQLAGITGGVGRPPEDWGILRCYQVNGYSQQVLASVATGNVISRIGGDGNYGPWSRLANQNDINEVKQSGIDAKNVIVTAVNSKGGNVSGNNTFPQIATAINNIPVGVKKASGTAKFNAIGQIEVTGLDFRPSVVFGIAVPGIGDSYSMASFIATLTASNFLDGTYYHVVSIHISNTNSVSKRGISGNPMKSDGFEFGTPFFTDINFQWYASQ